MTKLACEIGWLIGWLLNDPSTVIVIRVTLGVYAVLCHIQDGISECKFNVTLKTVDRRVCEGGNTTAIHHEWFTSVFINTGQHLTAVIAEGRFRVSFHCILNNATVQLFCHTTHCH